MQALSAPSVIPSSFPPATFSVVVYRLTQPQRIALPSGSPHFSFHRFLASVVPLSSYLLLLPSPPPPAFRKSALHNSPTRPFIFIITHDRRQTRPHLSTVTFLSSSSVSLKALLGSSLVGPRGKREASSRGILRARQAVQRHELRYGPFYISFLL